MVRQGIRTAHNLHESDAARWSKSIHRRGLLRVCRASRNEAPEDGRNQPWVYALRDRKAPQSNHVYSGELFVRAMPRGDRP